MPNILEAQPKDFLKFVTQSTDGRAYCERYAFNTGSDQEAPGMSLIESDCRYLELRDTFHLMEMARSENNDIQMAEMLKAFEGSFSKRFTAFSDAFDKSKATGNPNYLLKRLKSQGLVTSMNEPYYDTFEAALEIKKSFDREHMFRNLDADGKACFLAEGNTDCSYDTYTVLAMGLDRSRPDRKQIRAAAEALGAKVVVPTAPRPSRFPWGSFLTPRS